MSLHANSCNAPPTGQPIRIGLIGAGKFGSMYLAQVPRTPGVHLVGIADLSPDAARRNLARVGWAAERTQAASLDEALAIGRDAHRRRLAGAGAPSGDRRRSSNAPATRSPRSTTAWRRFAQASTWST